MTTIEQEGAEPLAPRRPAIQLPRLRWTQILAISIFWLALNFHWAALGIIILPSQVFKLVGELQKGEALAFGLGYGAYTSVDWALVADVLSSHKNYARDMGVWNISLSLPQVIAPVIGGPLLDSFTKAGQPVLGFQLLFAMAIVYCLIGTVTVRYIRGVKR